MARRKVERNIFFDDVRKVYYVTLDDIEDMIYL